MVGIMANLPRLSGSFSSVLLVIVATSVVADDRSTNHYDKKLDQLIETYNKACGTTKTLANITAFFKSNASNLAKECKPKKIEGNIYSVLSKANNTTMSDLEYRNWYHQSITRIRSILDVDVPHSMSLSHKKIDIRSINRSTIKGLDQDSKPKILTPKGFITVSGD
jgi:hypothetical protein